MAKNKKKSLKMKANEKLAAAQVVEAIKGSGGIKAQIARRLNVHRHTVDRYLREYSSARQAYEDEVQTVGDKAESVIISSINDDDVSTAKWYAKSKLKDRGYVEKQEVEQSGFIGIKGYIDVSPKDWDADKE